MTPAASQRTCAYHMGRDARPERSTGGGPVATIVELAERESIAPSHMPRVVRLALIVPDIVEAILDGKQWT